MKYKIFAKILITFSKLSEDDNNTINNSCSEENIIYKVPDHELVYLFNDTDQAITDVDDIDDIDCY